MTQRDTFDLEALFEDARANPPQMRSDLSARILADAETQMPRVPLWRRVMGAVGGPAGLGGLVTATVAGFWIGVSPPVDTVDPLVLFGAVESTAAYELTDLTGFDWATFDLDSEEG
ncbi:hypothetical protein [uncultured Sulfitobacter sp.]|uniref:hypothetical protein n=1 Tax=uncultured Sulfitobacter sp. TaxID=191468 RepID=UPI00262F1112|nr:hypothetical protein [uncultured Sulfitobacter sp.]